MPLKLNSTNGSVTISAEDGSGNVNVTIPRSTLAGLDSPALTGTPTAPTATASTNNTQIATTAYVDGAVTNLVDSAPATLDTLNELAAALGDDANFSTTVTNSIATKLPLAGGTMTGNINLNDSVRAVFGTGSDLQIYHDGSNSIIDDTGTGNLRIKGQQIDILTGSNENAAYFETDGTARLYYDGSIKIATTSAGVDITGKANVNGTLDIEEVYEKVNTSTGTSGTIGFDTDQYGVLYYTANQAANRTINFANVNANLGVGQSVTCTVLLTQGSTAYYLNAYQVDGTAVTPKWSGGSAPTAGNASGIDVYTFTIIKTADATFTVLASQTQYA